MKSIVKHALIGATLLAAATNAHATDSVKVFFLAGQSNMRGHGRIETGNGNVAGAVGSLRYLVNNDAANYGHLVDGGGNWDARSDVWVWSHQGSNIGSTTTTTGDLGTTFGAGGDKFGPELGFGHVLGDHYDEQVVLIKTAWGGKSLYEDFRPPSAGGTTGAYYTEMVSQMNTALADVATQFAGQAIEIEGFVWHQGWNDRADLTVIDNTTSPTTHLRDLAVAEYEDNLSDLIADLRTEFSTPDLKVVIGTTGMGPDATFDPNNREPAWYNLRPKALAQDLVAAQQAVGAADPLASTVDAHPFWREDIVSPKKETEHWNQNAESYYLIGEGMGEAMVALVPEPSSLGLLALGGLALLRRRR